MCISLFGSDCCESDDDDAEHVHLSHLPQPASTKISKATRPQRRAKRKSVVFKQEEDEVKAGIKALRFKEDEIADELEWIDGKPSTICEQCNLTICVHRSTIITPAELKYHIENEGGMVLDPGEAVQQGIDALLSMAAGEGAGSAQIANDKKEEGVLYNASTVGEVITEKDGENSLPDEESKDTESMSVSPLRARYKLWVDRLSKKKRKLYPCDHCGNLYLTLARLIRHMPSHTGVFPYRCPLCTASFRTKDEMTKHDRRKHKRTASTGFPDGKYQCNICSISYHSKSALDKHVSNHSNEPSSLSCVSIKK